MNDTSKTAGRSLGSKTSRERSNNMPMKNSPEIKKLRENFEEMVPALTAPIEQEVAEIEAASDARLAKIDAETQAAFEKLKLQLAEMPDEDPNQPKIEGRKSLKELREEEFWQTWRGRRAVETLARGAAISEVMIPFQLQMQGLANEYEREVTVRLTEIARETEREALETYAKPLADNDCPGVEPADEELDDPCTGAKLVKMTLKKGAVRVIEKKYGVGGKTIAQTITVNLDRIVHWIWPEGTDYSVDKQGETAVVRVFEGQVMVTSDTGPGLTVAAGQQVTLPDGEISALVPEPARQFAGVPLVDIPLDSTAPEPYGDSVLRATDGSLPAEWIWQDPNKDLNGPGDATLEVVGAETLRVTTPNENDFWGYRADAPRLLHKTTGDFDLEAEISLESQGTNFAYSEFMIFTPQTPLGYLQAQMNAGALGAHYLIVGGGLAQADNLRKLRLVNRSLADAPDIPDVPVRVKLTRRGDQLKAYWSTDSGETWTLSTRQEAPLPETLWTGWVFKRMAYDGLNDEPAVTTLRDIHLTTAPLGSMPEADWDVISHQGTAIAQGAEVLMTLNGSEDSYIQAYSPGSIIGDFDLTVRFEAPPIEMQPEQERMIQVAVTSNDGKNHAYLRNAITPDWHRNDADMAINEGWNRYHSEDTQESSGRVRLVRKERVLSGYLWQDGDWVLLADWQDGFSDAVYLDLRYQLKTATPLLQTARFTIERLETEDGILIGSTENPPAAPGSNANPQPTSVPVTPTAEPLPTPALSGKQSLTKGALFDDFSSPALGWSVRDSESATTRYEDGGYAMLVKQPTYWVLSKIPGDFPNTVVEFDATVAAGSAGGMYGVICHYKDSENYDFVAVDPESKGVLAGRQTAGAIHLLSGGADGATGQPAKGLAPSVTDINHVRAGCYDDRLELAIGGVTEGKWALDPPGTAGSAALFVYGFKRLGENGYQTLFDNVAAAVDRPDATSAVSTPAAPAPTCAKAVDPAIAPQWDRDALGCPSAPAQTMWAAVQAFEHGLMLWRSDSPLIYTFYDPGGWTRWPDVWSEGVDVPTRGQPPAGLQSPLRGFGFVWGIEDEVFRQPGLGALGGKRHVCDSAELREGFGDHPQ